MPKRKQSPCANSGKEPDTSPKSAKLAVFEGPRKVLPDFNSLDKLIDALRSSKRIIAVTGAGIRQDSKPQIWYRLKSRSV